MNEGETELLAAIARVVATFDKLGVDYLIGGSVASSGLAYDNFGHRTEGQPRLTWFGLRSPVSLDRSQAVGRIQH